MSLHRDPIWSFISNCFEGGGIAYIYLWVSKKWQVVYVGQTNNAMGTIGRACGHLGEYGTLRCRFEELVGVRLEEADDLFLISYALPQQPEYVGEESSYREAVEYQVLYKLTLLRGQMTPTFRLISENRYNVRAAYPTVEQYAEAIVSDFQANYPSLGVTN
jgi:hypothetical protein